jgi:predicted small metal-binding protein
MRVIECNYCGEALSAANDEELIAVTQRHMDDQHPEAARDEDRVRETVAAQAYDASDS